MKAKNFLIICMLSIAVLSMTSCSTRRAAVSDLESLVMDVEENGKSYSMDDWKMVIYRYSKIEERLQKHDYTKEEHKEIGNLKGRLLGNATKDVLINCYETIENINSEIDGGKEGFIKALLLDFLTNE